MHFESVRPPGELHGSESPAPTGDGREPMAVVLEHHWPVVKYDRLASGTPGDAPRRNLAIGRADVFADGEVEIVFSDVKRRVRIGIPELRETWINVDIGLAADAFGEWREREVPAQIHQEVRRLGNLEQPRPWQPCAFCTAGVNERCAIGDAEPLSH